MAFGTDSSDDAEGRLSNFPTQGSHIVKDNEVKNATQSKQNKCDVIGCGKIFSRPWRLNIHKAIHLGQKPFPCDVDGCDKAYTSVYHLKRHTLSVHSSSNNSLQIYKCSHEGCTAEFKFKQNERRHFKRTHEKKSCKTCGKSFLKQSLLKAHRFYHTGIPPYKCELCLIGFIKFGDLQRHNRGHREHICPIAGCIEVYEKWSSLRKHLSQHPSEYNCYYCKRPYRVKKHLKAHVIKHMTSTDPLKLRQQSQLKRYNCTICFASLLGKASLKRHIKLIHENPQTDEVNKPVKTRALRKDKGIPKLAMASTLSSVSISEDVKVKLFKGEQMAQNDITNAIQSKQIFETQMVLVEDSTSESDSTILKED